MVARSQLTLPVTVPNGGTGSATLTSNQSLWGNGASALVADSGFTRTASGGRYLFGATDNGVDKVQVNGSAKVVGISSNINSKIGSESFGLNSSDGGTSATTNNTIVGANSAITQTWMTYSTNVGAGISNQSNQSTNIGAGITNIGSSNSCVIGAMNSVSYSSYAVVMGSSILISGGGTLNLGYVNGVTHNRSAAIGTGVSTSQAGELVWGTRFTATQGVSFRLEGCTSLYTGRSQYRVNATWISSVDATRKSAVDLSAYDTAERVGVRMETTGAGVITRVGQGWTVATLPAATVGFRGWVTDALAPVWGAAVAGGGAVVVPVFHDGTQWIVG